MSQIISSTGTGLLVGGSAYAAVVYFLSGASTEEALAAMPFGVTYNTVSGRPFGWFLDKYRKFWGTTPVYDKSSE